MKFLSDNFMVLFLAFVIGVSPLQTVAASASKCMDMNKNMHAQVNRSDSAANTEMKHSGSTEDCCNKNECGTTHCASATIAAIIFNNTSDVTYTLGSVYQNPNVILLPIYSSSLYRPPKV